MQSAAEVSSGLDRRFIAGRTQARRRALQALYQWQLTGHSARELVQQFREEQDMGSVDQEYFAQLIAGVINTRERLDEVLAPHLDRPLEQVDLMERAILRLAAFELLECIEVPYRVVINEAINLARTFGAEGGHAYVNGVLDPLSVSARDHEYQQARSD